MVKMTGKMNYGLEVVKYFSHNEWTFKSDNLIALWSQLNPTDQKEFNFNMASIDWPEMANSCYFGNRRFLLKETEDTIPFARKRMQRLGLVKKLLKLILTIERF